MRLRHLLDLGQHLAERRGIAHDGAEVEFAVSLARQDPGVLGKLFGQAAILAHQMEALDRLDEDAAQLLAVPRLGHVAIDTPEIDGLDQHVHIGEGGHDDADGVRPHLANRAQQFETAHAWHALVGDHHGHVMLARQRQRLLATARVV